MTGTVIKEFLVSLGLQTEGAQGFEGVVNKATLTVAGLGAAVFAATGALFVFTKAVADYYDNLGDMSSRTDIAVGAIEEFGYVAQLTGSSVDAANSSLEAFSRTVGDAANGMGRAQKVFEQLGIKVKGANGEVKETTELLAEVGDKIKDMDRGQQVAILGRLGIDKTLVDALTTDVGGLRDEFKKLYSAVGLDSEQAAEKSGKFMDALDRLDFVVSTVGRSLAVNFMDRFTDALDSLRKLIVDNLPAIMRAVKPIIGIILNLADVFIALTYRIAQGAGVIIGWVADIVGQMNGWVVTIGLVTAAWKIFNLSFLATPVGAVIALAVALGLLIDDFMTWREGGESLIAWEEWQSEIDIAIAIIDVFKNALEIWFNILFNIIDAVIKLFTGDFAGAIESAKNALQGMADFVYSLFGPVLDFVGEQFRAAFAFIGSIIDSVIGQAKAAVEFVKGAATSVGSFLGIVDEVPQPEQAGPAKASALPTGPVPISAMSKPAQIGPVLNPMTPPPALVPSPMAMAGSSPAKQTITQETNITVQGSNNPEATGKAVAGQQSQVNGDMARNLKGAVR